MDVAINRLVRKAEAYLHKLDTSDNSFLDFNEVVEGENLVEQALRRILNEGSVYFYYAGRIRREPCNNDLRHRVTVLDGNKYYRFSYPSDTPLRQIINALVLDWTFR